MVAFLTGILLLFFFSFSADEKCHVLKIKEGGNSNVSVNFKHDHLSQLDPGVLTQA